MSRPAHYYIGQLVALTPLVLVVLACSLLSAAVRRDRHTRLALGWFLFVVLATTAVSATGVGFLTRHITSSVPAIYVLAAVCLVRLGRKVDLLPLIAVALIAYAALGSSYYLWAVPPPDEIQSLSDLVSGSDAR